jgi:hypothetical protein
MLQRLHICNMSQICSFYITNFILTVSSRVYKTYNYRYVLRILVRTCWEILLGRERRMHEEI